VHSKFAPIASWRPSAPLMLLSCLILVMWNASRATTLQSCPPAARTNEARPLNTDQIISRLQERNRERATALRRFRGTRLYHLHYQGFFGTRDARAVVTLNFAAPNDKQFTVVSQTGSTFLINHVIKALLEGEKDAATEDNLRRTALTDQNYDFTLNEADTAHETSQYVLNVTPKTDSKFLYRGRIWVDAHDFAVTRIEAEPAKSPSVWVRKSEIGHRYEKVGDFWLPAENKTDSTMRLGGHAVLCIEYKDYTIIEAAPVEPNNQPGPNVAPTAFTDLNFLGLGGRTYALLARE
jgi:hypothetical protein